MTNVTSKENGKQTTKSTQANDFFKISDSQLNALVTAFNKQGETVYTVGKILSEAKAKETKDYELVARKLLELNSLAGRLKAVKGSNELEYAPMQATTLKSYQSMYEYFCVIHLESFTRATKLATMTEKRLDVKLAFIKLASLQLTVLRRYVALKSHKDLKQRNKVSAPPSTIRDYLESGRGELIARLVPKAEAKNDKHVITLKLDNATFKEMQAVKLDLKLESASFEKVFLASAKRYEEVKTKFEKELLRSFNQDKRISALEQTIRDLEAKLARQSTIDTSRKPNSSRKPKDNPKPITAL